MYIPFIIKFFSILAILNQVENIGIDFSSIFVSNKLSKFLLSFIPDIYSGNFYFVNNTRFFQKLLKIRNNKCLAIYKINIIDIGRAKNILFQLLSISLSIDYLNYIVVFLLHLYTKAYSL